MSIGRDARTIHQPMGNTLDKEHCTGIARKLVDRFNTAAIVMVGKGSASDILDVACGDGWLTSLLAAHRPEATFVGVDRECLEQRARWCSREEHNLRFDVADLYNLPFPDRQFDVVTMFEALEHCDDPRGALREMLRVSRQGIVVSVPWEPWWRIANVIRGKYLAHGGNTPGHVNHWGRRAFTTIVASEAKVLEVTTSALWTIVRAERHDAA